jgi:hypothetical protein
MLKPKSNMKSGVYQAHHNPKTPHVYTNTNASPK